MNENKLSTAAIVIIAIVAFIFLSPFLAFLAAFIAKVGLIICSIALGIFGALLGIFSALGGILLAAATIFWALIGGVVVAIVDISLVVALPALLIYWIYVATTESRNWKRVEK